MSSIKGNPKTLGDFARSLRRLWEEDALVLASHAAERLTEEARAVYQSGQTVYRTERPAGDFFGYSRPSGLSRVKRGGRRVRALGGGVSLVKSGETLGAMRFAAVGTRVRAVLGTLYARYLVGRYSVLPPGGSSIPVPWQLILRKLVEDQIARRLGGRGGR